MGLIKAAKNAIGSTLKDQWKEAIRCEDMTNDILMMKKTTPTGVITNKSTIVVAPGQCAVIYDNGRVIDATAEDGLYTFDTSSSPSFFAGQFGPVFKEMWQRFTYNGATAKQQSVFFFNIKEIIDNKFGTPAPIPFQDWSHPIPNQMTNSMSPLRVEVKCFGKYTFKIANPAVFMSEMAGIADVFKKEDLVEQMRAEVIATFQNVLNELGNSIHKVPVLELPSQTDEIKQIMDERVFDEPIRRRGIEIVGFVVESVTLDEESEKKIDDYELSSNSYMQQGTLVGAYANAVQDAANNKGGAMNGFMGIGMMNMASGGMVGGAVQGPWQQTNGATQNFDPYAKQQAPVEPTQTPVQSEQTPAESQENKPEPVHAEQPQEPAVSGDTWTCPNCGAVVSGKFCTECGMKKPEVEEKRVCKKCGAELAPTAKFCPECGEKYE